MLEIMQTKLDLDVNKRKIPPQANEAKYPKKYLRGTRVCGGGMSSICRIYYFGRSNKTASVCQFKMYDEILEIRLYPYAIKSYFNEQERFHHS